MQFIAMVMVTWTHDVGPGEDELDGALVHPLGGEQEGELVEEPQGGDPGLVVMSANECRVNKSITNCIMDREEMILTDRAMQVQCIN